MTAFNDRPIVVGVSGGVDSMYLLHTLMTNPENKIVVAHVNYHYRSDSDLDAELVRDTCKANNIPCYVLDAPPYPLTGFEEWARDIRYGFFNTIAEGVDASRLFIAHNANDQAETVVMNKQRGCGLYGEGGMRSHTYRNGVNIHRPLLDMTKSEIYAKARELGVKWREDSTNTDTTFTRNAIRATMTDSDVADICQDARLARQQYDYEVRCGRDMYAPIYTKNVEVIVGKPTEKEIWSQLVHSLLHESISLTKRHFDMLLSSDPHTNVIQLPNGWVADKRKKRTIKFTKKN